MTMNHTLTHARPVSRKGYRNSVIWGILFLALLLTGAAAYQPVQHWVTQPRPLAISLRGDLPDIGSLASQLRDDIAEAQASQRLAEKTGYDAVTQAVMDAYAAKLHTLALAGVRQLDETKTENLSDPAKMLERTGYWNGYAARLAEHTKVNVEVGARGECEKNGCVLHFAW